MSTRRAPGATVCGVVVHYIAETGLGFLREADDPDELHNLHFDLTSCDVQTPPPRVGERVLYAQLEGPSRPIVTAVYRMQYNPVPARAAPPTNPEAHYGRDRPTHRTPNTSPPKPRGSAKPGGSKRHDAPDTSSLSVHKAVDAKRKLLAAAPSFYEGGPMPRYVYVDLDNVWVSYVRAEHLVDRFPGAQTTRDLELDLDGLTRRLAQGERGSKVSRLVAFYYNTPEAVAARLRTMSYDGVDWDVRKQETTTDTSMQLELLNAKRPCSKHPKTLVLVTGDGNIAPNGMCFREIMDLYLRDGWFVEVHAWLFTMATTYINYQREYPSTVVLRPFDDEDVGEILRSRQQRGNRNGTHGNVARQQPRVRREPRVGPSKGFTPAPMEDERMEDVDEVRLSTRTEVAAAHAAPVAMSMEKPSSRSFRPEQYAEVIRQLEGPDGSLYVPTGLAMLARSGSRVVVDSLTSMDAETQHLMLTMALHDEMDAATMQQLREQVQEPVGW